MQWMIAEPRVDGKSKVNVAGLRNSGKGRKIIQDAISTALSTE
jgi:hypothetical protein